MQDYEKLGLFYLGRAYDLAARQARDDLVLYESRNLVTHGVCVGMTGSGKTGLCLTVLEEAAIDGIPAIVIDPKGDLANLLLTFPQLRGEDFAPWVDEEEARRSGKSVDEYAVAQAERWKQGLADWGQSPDRIARLKEAADFAIYTPGSNAGLSVSILSSFRAPPPEQRDDAELLGDRIATTVSSLLGLLGIEADPLQSREHILLSTIVQSAWSQGQDLDVARIIEQVQSPPTTRIGVMDLESFFPGKERFALAMRLNNLLASPGFSAWMEGEPLEIDQLLHTAQGKPRVAIFSIAHLSDSERMFFVSLLLNQVVGWMRGQSGTTSLRALVYMDEILGYFPPIANPPSKAPMLTLLKQARAFGVGLLLATQNPVDLDYKGLSNAGTWFIGRLQTERDKARVLDGLEGAAAGASATFDRQAMEQTLAGLGNRVFLLHSVHESAPEIFQVRWTMSYLRGPLTRNQIKQLTGPRQVVSAADADAHAASVAACEDSVPSRTAAAPANAAPAAGEPSVVGQRAVLAPEIPQTFLAWREPPSGSGPVAHAPLVLGSGKVFFSDAKTGVECERSFSLLAPISEDTMALDWSAARAVELDQVELQREPPIGATFASLPSVAARAKSYDTWKKSFADHLYRNCQLELFRSTTLKQVSKLGESERDFRVRLQQAAREERDRLGEKLRQKYAPKLNALRERLRRAQQAVERESVQASQQKTQTVISFGATLLGAFLGRKKLSSSTLGKATSTLRGVGRSMKESQDISRAEDTAGAIEGQLADLEAAFQAEMVEQQSRLDPATEPLEAVAIKPKKSNVTVQLLTLAWSPSAP